MHRIFVVWLGEDHCGDYYMAIERLYVLHNGVAACFLIIGGLDVKYMRIFSV